MSSINHHVDPKVSSSVNSSTSSDTSKNNHDSKISSITGEERGLGKFIVDKTKEGYHSVMKSTEEFLGHEDKMKYHEEKERKLRQKDEDMAVHKKNLDSSEYANHSSSVSSGMAASGLSSSSSDNSKLSSSSSGLAVSPLKKHGDALLDSDTGSRNSSLQANEHTVFPSGSNMSGSNQPTSSQTVFPNSSASSSFSQPSSTSGSVNPSSYAYGMSSTAINDKGNKVTGSSSDSNSSTAKEKMKEGWENTKEGLSNAATKTKEVLGMDTAEKENARAGNIATHQKTY
jgi:hypothetical protein